METDVTDVLTKFTIYMYEGRGRGQPAVWVRER